MPASHASSPLRFEEIAVAFGQTAGSQALAPLWERLNTLRRPKQPDFEEGRYYDWVLVRPAGVELGFVEAAYHAGEAPFRWGFGELVLVQAYFYSGFDDIKPYTGTLPHGLTFADSRDVARQKLVAYEASRHSYTTDAWDIDGYRLTVTYLPDDAGIDRLVCRVLPAPLSPEQVAAAPGLDEVVAQFGTPLNDPVWQALWPAADVAGLHADAFEDGELNLLDTYGATLAFAGQNRDRYLRSLALHRNRDRNSVGWRGPLPEGLSFEDSPQTLREKLGVPPDDGNDLPETGFALWHRTDYTLHVLYSHVDNRLIRVTLIAPGVWRSVFDDETRALLRPEGE